MDTTQTTSLRNQFNTEALGKFGQILMTRNDISRKSKLKWGKGVLLFLNGEVFFLIFLNQCS